MIRFIRARATYANVIATVALFFSLSGVGMATHLVVRSSDIKDNEVKSVDVRNDHLKGGGLRGQDIASNALTGADIDESSLQGSCGRTMAPVGDDLCYQTGDGWYAGDFPRALVLCRDEGWRLPTLAEAFEAREGWNTREPIRSYWTSEGWIDGVEKKAWIYRSPNTFDVAHFTDQHWVRCVTTRLPEHF